MLFEEKLSGIVMQSCLKLPLMMLSRVSYPLVKLSWVKLLEVMLSVVNVFLGRVILMDIMRRTLSVRVHYTLRQH